MKFSLLYSGFFDDKILALSSPFRFPNLKNLKKNFSNEKIFPTKDCFVNK